MKKLIFPLLVAGLFAVPSLAHSATNPYVSISGGLGLMNNSAVNGIDDRVEYKSGYLINGAIGLKADYARLEAEIGYHRNNLDTWDGSPAISDSNISAWSFMANGYLDYHMADSDITPFMMVGLGVACVNGSDGTNSYDDSVFAWQVGAGVGFKTSETVTIDIGYRYFATAEAVLDADTFSISSHNIIADIRCGF